jgi:hypothetical protein
MIAPPLLLRSTSVRVIVLLDRVSKSEAEKADYLTAATTPNGRSKLPVKIAIAEPPAG